MSSYDAGVTESSSARDDDRARLRAPDRCAPRRARCGSSAARVDGVDGRHALAWPAHRASVRSTTKDLARTTKIPGPRRGSRATTVWVPPKIGCSVSSPSPSRRPGHVGEHRRIEHRRQPSGDVATVVARGNQDRVGWSRPRASAAMAAATDARGQHGAEVTQVVRVVSPRTRPPRRRAPSPPVAPGDRRHRRRRAARFAEEFLATWR